MDNPLSNCTSFTVKQGTEVSAGYKFKLRFHHSSFSPFSGAKNVRKLEFSASLLVSCGSIRSPLLHDFDEDHVTISACSNADWIRLTRKITHVNP